MLTEDCAARAAPLRPRVPSSSASHCCKRRIAKVRHGPEPSGDGFGEPAKCHRPLGCHMEALAQRRVDRCRSASSKACATSSACTWCSVSSPAFGSSTSSPRASRADHVQVEVARRSDGHPARPDDVARVQRSWSEPHRVATRTAAAPRLRPSPRRSRRTAAAARPRSPAPRPHGRAPRWCRSAAGVRSGRGRRRAGRPRTRA